MSTDSLLSIDSLLLANIDAASSSHCSQQSYTPDVYRKPLSGGSFDAVQKAMAAVRSSGGKSAKMIWNKGTLRANHSNGSSLHSSTFTTNRHSQLSIGSYGSQEALPSAVQIMHRASLYIFGDKNQSKILKLDPKCEFVPVEYPQTHMIKEVFKKFLRAVVPAALPMISDGPYSPLKALEESGWHRQIQSLLHIANAIVDVIDLQNSSVAVCLENGWDATTQVVSISELLLDPFYRTIDGFKVLIEKEWLAFGHRFSHRCNHTASTAASGFAPVFLQFLDVVHQIHVQYPAAFEFNDFYLRFLAFHSSSAYFRTFLLNCESDRVESGLLQFDCKPRPRPEIAVPEDIGGNSSVTGQIPHSLGKASAITNVSIWDYIDEKHRRSCVFYNFLYSKGRYSVLRPQFTLASYDLWEFYTEDPISIGSPYDLEVVETELLERSADRSDNLSDNVSISSTTGHRIIDPGYDSIIHSQPNCFSTLLEEICSLQRELDVLPEHWETVLFKIYLSLEVHEEESAQISFIGEWARWLSRTLHKKSTIELLLRGRMATQALGKLSRIESGQRHNFVKCSFTTPEHCHVCNRIIWGVVRQGLKCSVCDFVCHEKCASVNSLTCNRSKGSDSVSPQSSAISAEESRVPENADDVGSLYSQVLSAETRTHEGYLMKRGALLKAWKQRWFVLDSIQHQLRYYEFMEDSHCKGFIDLGEIIAIGPSVSSPGSPRPADTSYFELRTTRRLYSFMANNSREAQEWIEKIQSCLQ
ncbi:unnamed protein product [Soboliphyme baturini]|uniref:Myotubularin phosphatase domain-containing protein n=1 Tax=Soboliphyme baturini TaxID=241478 RepID=A0A183IM33_9BILA|nr:unnamed protein product [Soboliphyme baturini]